MYIYEGEDYSKLCSDKDKKSFDELLAGEVVNGVVVSVYWCPCYHDSTVDGDRHYIRGEGPT